MNISVVTRISRHWLAAIALLAMLCQGLVPAGYMPDFGGHRGGLMPLRICTGDGFTTIKVSADKYAAPGKAAPASHHTPHAPCDYALNHVFGFAGLTAALLSSLLFILLTLLLPPEFSVSPRRYFGTLAARAPPIFS
jgi:hypothetical protein